MIEPASPTEVIEHGVAPRRTRRWLAAGFAVIAILVVLAMTARLAGDGRTVHDSGSGGSLDGGEASDTISIWAIELGQPVTMGHLVVSNTGEKPLVLERLRLLPALPAGIEFIGAVTAQDPNRDVASIGAGRSYPPDSTKVGRTRPLAGTVVPPGADQGAVRRGTAILVGLRLNCPGAFGFDRMEVDYRVGEKPYTMRADIGFVGCGPPAEYPEACPSSVSDAETG